MNDERARWWTTAPWIGHGVLRAVLMSVLVYYAWSKIILGQMGPLDYAEALTAFGERSPMAELWTFMATSPVVQILAGVAELVASVLLIWRRTAWLGGLLGALDMGVVFLLNMTFGVPIKQLSLALTVGFLIVAAPELPRVARFVAGLPTGGYREPRPIVSRRVRAVSRYVLPVLGVLVVVGAGAQTLTLLPPQTRADVPPAGVWRVAGDAAPPAPALATDQRWADVAFGQWELADGTARMAVRRADGGLQLGVYRRGPGGTVDVDLNPPRAGYATRPRELRRPVSMTLAPRRDGRIALTGGGQALLLEPDAAGRLLFDQPFRWS